MLSEISQLEKDISYDFTYKWNLKDRINENKWINRTNQKQIHREQTNGCQMGECKGMGTKEIKECKLPIIKQSQDCKYNTGHVANNTGITVHDARWALDLLCWLLYKVCKRLTNSVVRLQLIQCCVFIYFLIY